MFSICVNAVRKLPLFLLALLPQLLAAEWIWVEGEDAVESTARRRHSWYEDVKKDQLSGGDFMTNFSETGPGTASYEFTVKAAGNYRLYLRANPVQAHMSFSLNGGAEQEVNFAGEGVDRVNLASNGAPDLRFVSWMEGGSVPLKSGRNTLKVTFDSPNPAVKYHGMLDCFILTNEPFQPRGAMKPDALARDAAELAKANAGWRAWGGRGDTAPRPLSLRRLNEAFAGENGRILSKGGHFVRERTGKPVRFWAVNGPPHALAEPALSQATGTLADYGVNLVRLHGAMFDQQTGRLNPAEVEQNRRIIKAAKAQGIYSELSIYFPLWLQPRGDLPFLKGYSGGKHPFAALYFNPDFQEVYRGWWRAVLTEPGADGARLVDEPALMGLELVNEDSFFFWTFDYKNIPAPQAALIEGKFAQWVKARYGSYEKAFAAWGGQRVPQDAPDADRLGLRPLWNVFKERTARDQDFAAFLLETQRQWYADHIKFLRELGYKGLITCSNWTTADDRVLGPLEKYSYTVGDFVDRHGYVGGVHQGSDSGWSIREGHIFGHRSILKFEGAQPGSPKAFTHPVMDPKYNGLPSMISETTWTRPNRFRGEAPLYYAIYGALQDSDAIVHFAHDGANWEVKPRFFMQPWTLMAPTQMGQFPAAALIYRQGLVDVGEVMADVRLDLKDLRALKGTPLVQSASLDELRKADTLGGTVAEGGSISPLVHYVGRTNVVIGDNPGKTAVRPLGRFIDLEKQTVRSSTGQVLLDYGKGILAVNAPRVQVVCGNIAALKGQISLDVLELTTPLEYVYLALVPLDGLPLAQSKSMFLQVMTEEKPAEWATEPAGNGLERITNLGRDPWMIRSPDIKFKLKRPDSAAVKVSPLSDDFTPLTGMSEGAAYYHLTVQ